MISLEEGFLGFPTETRPCVLAQFSQGQAGWHPGMTTLHIYIRKMEN